MTRSLEVARALLAEAAVVQRERDPAVAGPIAAGLFRDAARWALHALEPQTAPEAMLDRLAAQLPPNAKAAVLDGSPADESQLGVLETSARWLVAQAEGSGPHTFDVTLFVRRGFLVLGGLAIAAVVGTAIAIVRTPVDLAEGLPLRTSSSAGDCHPERSECMGARTKIRFHTLEEDSPWAEVDLGAPTQIRAMTIENRSDGYAERAVPLTLEASDDRATWRLLARRDDAFATWRAAFSPTTARYVRARVERRSVLHLDGLHVHP